MSKADQTQTAELGTLRLTRYPATEVGGFARWEMTVEETGELIAKGGFPFDEEAARAAADGYRARFQNWTAHLLENGERHVVPNGDLREHATDNTCWCAPFEEDDITVHNSMDRREEYERGREPS